jgi:hypothetical protein
MLSTARTLSPFITVILILSLFASGCGSSQPTFVETAPPESRIVVKTDPWDNCDTAGDVTRTFTTKNTRSQETAWWVEGKAGVGGKIPLGFLIPSLDIEASISNHYGRKETRTWESTVTDTYTVPGSKYSVMVVYYQEITRKGLIRVYDKEIEYEYPAELSVLAHRKVDMLCNPLPIAFMMCIRPLDGSQPQLSQNFSDLAGTWVLSSPSRAELVKLEIGIDGPNVLIHAYTNGDSGVADWGVQYQCVHSDPMVVKFDQLLFKSTTLTLHNATNGTMRATAVDMYLKAPIAIPPQTTEYIFKKR